MYKGECVITGGARPCAPLHPSLAPRRAAAQRELAGLRGAVEREAQLQQTVALQRREIVAAAALREELRAARAQLAARQG